MTIGIIDDETRNRLLLKSILQAYAPEEQIIVDEGLIEPAIEKLNHLRPDVVFLDIELKNGTGFDILKGLTYSPEVIFTTAYSQYAIDAIKVHAFDYILKPINEKELVASLNQCRNKIEKNKTQEVPAPIGKSFFNIATVEGKISLNYADIFYFESSGSYTYCATPDKKILFSRNIGEVEKELPKNIFFRTHHSFIVNLTKVNKIEIKRNGKLHLNNSEVIPLAQRKIKEFKQFFNNGNGPQGRQ